ncbi:MAG: HAD family phosphatase [Clostridiales bacterium]|nr:HAD family phosphatase [Clostridiales bacterium]
MKNIIFDMGNVLIKWAPAHFIEREGISDPGDAGLLMSAIYRSPEWPMLDRGDIDEPDMERIALERLPARLHKAAKRLISAWNDPIEPVDGMEDFVRECKAAGMGIYLLSNASRRQSEYWPNVPASECFDGRVISAIDGFMKPDIGIYELLLNRYGLEAGDCLFVDDVKANVDGAEAAGMKGFVFSGDVGELRRAVFG